ncbi:MAG: MATE family efflux transporter [Clostridia bacterium]|nr:MATE family efflux transporter [Clostridia bacterium]
MLFLSNIMSNIKNSLDSNREFISKVSKIAIPIALQSVIMSLLNMADQVMVGQLGEKSIAAVGMSNRMITILMFVLNAIAAGVSVYTAQFWGKKETGKIGQLMGIGLFSGGIVTAIFVCLSVFAPEFCIGIFSNDKEVMSQGAVFLKIVGYSYIPSMLTVMFSAVLRSTTHVKLPVIASITGVVLDVILNYVLIFGRFGFPEMGLEGAAVSTVIARIVELLIILAVTYKLKLPAAFSFKQMRGVSKPLLVSYFNITYPFILNEFLWVLGETVYSIIYGRIGTLEYTAVAITAPIQGITIGALSGLASATAVILGNAIGANKEDNVLSYAKKFVKLSIVFSACLGVLIILMSKFYIGIYNVSEETGRYAGYLMLAFAFFLWVKVSNMIIGSGILSSGGDSKFILVMESSTTWLFGVPSGFIAAFALGLPVYWVYIILSCEEIIRFVIGLRRVYSRKWIKNLVSNL